MNHLNYDEAVQASLDYLGSPAALQSLKANAYWPKWNSPWWHMLLLHEMGLTQQIPAAPIHLLVEVLQASALKIFPIQPEDMPAGVDPYDTHCHCSLGNIYQVLAGWGVDVDQLLPWIRPWFLRYQMADGGFNCDNDAYLVEGECASSMVGTIACLEAILLHTPRPWTESERNFLRSGARFLSQRQLHLGSTSKHNAEERTVEGKWLQLCFPRFYLYDVLRGLRVLQTWEKNSGEELPANSLTLVRKHLQGRYPDGVIRPDRHCYEGIGTRQLSPAGNWEKAEASRFPLLDLVSQIGQPSAYLTQQWKQLQVN